MRTCYDMAVRAGMHGQPVILAFSQRVRQVGKTRSMALAERMRELVTSPNAVLKNRMPLRAAASQSLALPLAYIRGVFIRGRSETRLSLPDVAPDGTSRV